MEDGSLSPAEGLFLEFRSRRERGEIIGIEELCAEHPEHGGELRKLWEIWRDLHLSATASRSAQSTRELDTTDPGSGDLLRDRITHGATDPQRYSVESEVARGGMGAIFRVHDQHLRRTLAMKQILERFPQHDGSTVAADPQTLGRFVEEAQVTSQLDHPGIVPVHELGVDAGGQTFFTMKLVKGRDLREILDMVKSGEEGWNQTRALNVLLRAGEALAFAHSRGVVHRDLKPGNIMVGRFGEAYVMDWGVARVLDQQDGRDLRIRQTATRRIKTVRSDEPEISPGTPLQTVDGHVVGTPAFMPPEQALGQIDQVGPQADVYSMGAILYQLLTGSIPYTDDERARSPHDILGRVQSSPPTGITALAPLAPAELIAICERAMARRIDDRYPDMSALVHDLRAFLENRVVRAYRTGPWIELRKWVSRNRGLAAACAALALLVAAATVGYLWLVTRSRNALAAERNLTRTKAEQLAEQLEVTEAVSTFLNQILTIDTWDSGPDVLAMDLVDRAAADVQETYADRPRLELPIQKTISRTYVELGALREAARHQERVVQLSEQLHGSESVQSVSARTDLAISLIKLDQLEGAGASVEGLLEPSVDRLGAAHPETIRLRAAIAGRHLRLGQIDDAASVALSALEDAGPVLNDSSVHLVHILGHVHDSRGEYELAEESYRRTYEYWLERKGPEAHPTAVAMSSLGGCLIRLERFDQAEPLLRRSMELNQARRAPEDMRTLMAMQEYAQLLGRIGRLDEAMALQREILEKRQEQLPDGHRDIFVAMVNLAATLGMSGQYEESLALSERARDLLASRVPPTHPTLVTVMMNIGITRSNAGRAEQAVEILRDTVDRMKDAFPESHQLLGQALHELGRALSEVGNHEEAVIELRAAWMHRDRHLGADDPSTRASRALLAAELDLLGRSEEAANHRTGLEQDDP